MVTIEPFERFDPLDIGEGAGHPSVFVLTGAGISAESGIATFRDAGGLWERHRFEDVASPAGFARDPALVWRFYSERRKQAASCQPNAAHRALADVEARVGGRFFLCTQNVDGLHARAGSARVHAMHGELFMTRCERCDREPFADDALYLAPAPPPRCACGGRLRPHICLFGEVPFGMSTIGEALARADVFVTIGSSGAVYPAAAFVADAREPSRARGGRRARTVYVGPEAPENAALFDECRLGPATAAVPSLFACT